MFGYIPPGPDGWGGGACEGYGAGYDWFPYPKKKL